MKSTVVFLTKAEKEMKNLSAKYAERLNKQKEDLYTELLSKYNDDGMKAVYQQVKIWQNN